MIVPNSERGYTLYSIGTAEMRTHIDKYKSKLLFQHHTKKYYYLVDRLAMYNSEIRDILDAVKRVSTHWFKVVKGSLINMMLRRYMVYMMNPQQYGHYGNYIFAANYCQLKMYLQKIAKVLICNYGFEDRYYKLHINKKKLFELSELWANKLMVVVEKNN